MANAQVKTSPKKKQGFQGVRVSFSQFVSTSSCSVTPTTS